MKHQHNSSEEAALPCPTCALTCIRTLKSIFLKIYDESQSYRKGGKQFSLLLLSKVFLKSHVTLKIITVHPARGHIICMRADPWCITLNAFISFKDSKGTIQV
ncbi:hypothetical protein XELAEV_18020476mg [Xenopus laevis]|uniref:Uncharacterized protein n=1 Tax=Xenopus laevis TaxID=8355 RepID=A0A974D9S0_XENLA|nr:hypothetical protein XELAEV_18020476mg [Xenopus laevis]